MCIMQPANLYYYKYPSGALFAPFSLFVSLVVLDGNDILSEE
jgi:hypothetical protein